MRNIAINKTIEHNMDVRQFVIHDMNILNMNTTDFCAFCHYLYSYMQNNPHKNEVAECFKQASLYMDHSILLKYKLMKDYRKPRQDELFEKFINIVKQYCSTEHSVRFYAEKLFITPQYLSKVSKDISGKTANVWIDEFVLLEAKTLLMHTNLTVQEISLKVGFSDQSCFGKFFRKHTGLSPRKFIQKYTR